MGAEAEAKAQNTARNSKTKGRGFFFDMAGAQRAKLSWAILMWSNQAERDKRVREKKRKGMEGRRGTAGNSFLYENDVAADVQNYKGTQPFFFRYHNLYCSVLGTGSHRQSPEIE